MLKRILPMALLAAGCGLGPDLGPDDAAYADPMITGWSVVYRNNVAVDSFASPADLIANYRIDIDDTLWPSMTFQLAGESFTARYRYIYFDKQRDTVVSGKLGRPDSGFINLQPRRSCDSTVGGFRQTNECFTKEGDDLIIRACVDMDFDSSDFDVASVKPGLGAHWRHLRGVRCSEAPPSDFPNRIRTDFTITFSRLMRA
ncbi:MAG: hypothetical protein JF616_04580 [Fibrobacteres bacterium]|nr:hypothetical protein [Fibrobacterota bacterium]